jgi:cytoskeleton protein RodZ
MSEPMADDDRPMEPAAEPANDGALSAGAILRAARERQGVHVAMLAAAIKVSPRKLDALENDRYDELPDATFTRALAQTVCRALKIDVAPVLAKLPQAGTTTLEQVSAGLNTPFRERPGRVEIGSSLPPMPLVWGGVALLLAAAAILLWPAGGLRWLSQAASGAASATAAAVATVTPVTPVAAPAPASAVANAPALTQAASAAGEAGAASAVAPAIETVHSAPPADPALMASTGATLVTSDASWVEIVDANGQTLLSRVVPPGETVNVDGALPLRLKIGNASATQLVFRGQAVDLAAVTRDNVARIELK